MTLLPSIAALVAGGVLASPQATVPDSDLAPRPVTEAGTVRAVTLYPDRAAVTRSVRAELGQGSWALRVPGLPRAVLPDSLQAKVVASGDGAPKLLGVEYAQMQGTAFTGSPEGKALAERVRELRRTLARLAEDRALLDQHDRLLDQVGVRPNPPERPDGSVEAIDTASAARQLRDVRAEKARLLGSAREMDDRKASLERELAAAERTVASRGGADRHERAGVVFLAVPRAGTVELELTYLVRDASWTPAYAVRTAGDRSGVTVEYEASVLQRTGEDWRDVRLALSTAQPTSASGPPAIEPWFVDVRLPPPPAERAVAMDAAAGAPQAVPGAPMPVVAKAARALEELAAPAEVVETGVAASFELPRTVTILSDASRRQRTPIASIEPEARFTYVTAPAVAEGVFLRGDLVNAGAYQLLPGPAQVFMGGEYVGSTDIPGVPPKGEFRVFLGQDRSISARREVVSKVTGASGLFGGSAITTWVDRITVDNGTGRDIRLEVYDRRPVSRDRRIEVRTSAVTPALSADKAYVERQLPQGILRWDLAVPASARGPKAATVGWTVELVRPGDLAITPVPD